MEYEEFQNELLAPQLIPAAQYVRMSKDFQQYSIENQTASISEYAARNGFKAVKTYTDAGRSGVVLKSRAGLTALLADVVKGGVEFHTVLVYDSRARPSEVIYLAQYVRGDCANLKMRSGRLSRVPFLNPPSTGLRIMQSL